MTAGPKLAHGHNPPDRAACSPYWANWPARPMTRPSLAAIVAYGPVACAAEVTVLVTLMVVHRPVPRR
jgi:hypothetical protein